MKHSIAIAGLGNRGRIHLRGILENPDRFEVAGIYDPKPEAVTYAREQFPAIAGVPAFSRAEEMLEKVKPEALVFVTHPNIRGEYVEMAAQYGVKAVSLEKPMATSLAEARKMAKTCAEKGIKGVVSHQQKYMSQMQKFYQCVRSGALGDIELIRIFTRPNASNLGTHFVDYALWANGGIGAEWVVGHVHGRGGLESGHPSANYVMGEARLKNGATLFIECGYLAPFTLPDAEFWVNNRLTVYGTRGYAWAETEGRCSIFSPETGGKDLVTQHPGWHKEADFIQTPYYTDFADWLDDDKKKHPCNIEVSLEGFEIIEALYKSALEHRRVDLPIEGEIKDAIEEMKKILPVQKYPAGFKDGNFYKNSCVKEE
jgi:predicted dehydrogenase